MLKVHGIVRLTRDPEITTVGSKETSIVKFGVAVNDYKDKGHFFDVTAFEIGKRDLPTIISNNFKMGDRMYIKDAELAYSKWKDNDGNSRSHVGLVLKEFEFVDGKKEPSSEPF